jgi:hypothetical protein
VLCSCRGLSRHLDQSKRTARTLSAWAEPLRRAVGFLERRGFVEDMRMWISALDLSQFDPSQFAHEVAAVEAQGIQLRSWVDLGFDDAGVGLPWR